MTVELLDAMAQEILALKEQIAFLESREVCAAAHENVETCGYCQRDALQARIPYPRDKVGWICSVCAEWNKPEDSLCANRHECNCDPNRWADHAPGCKHEMDI